MTLGYISLINCAVKSGKSSGQICVILFFFLYECKVLYTTKTNQLQVVTGKFLYYQSTQNGLRFPTKQTKGVP